MAKKSQNDKQLPVEIKETLHPIENLIYTIRGQQVMLDRDLALLYGVETKYLNRQVQRNLERFPKDFMFQLNNEEMDCLIRCQNVTLYSESMNYTQNSPEKFPNEWFRYQPYVFTENGIAMLSGVLRSPTAIEANIRIMRAFVAMRKMITSGIMPVRVENIETHQIEIQNHLALHDKQFDEVFKILDKKQGIEQGIFYDGQIHTAYTFVCELIKEAQTRIILIDNYIDESVLTLLEKRKAGVTTAIYTLLLGSRRKLDVRKHDAEFPPIPIHEVKNVHDRFLIIDDTVYLIGASIKDMGKKMFGFSKITSVTPEEILSRLK